MTPRGLDEGLVTFSFAARLPEQGAAPFTVEARGRGGVGETGFSLAFAADGNVKANGRPAGKLKPGSWTRFEIVFDLGKKRTGHCTLTVREADGENTVTLPFVKESFDQISWLGVTAPGNSDGCFYLDALKLSVSDPR